MVLLLGGGTHYLQGFRGGYEYFAKVPREGGIFYTHTKKTEGRVPFFDGDSEGGGYAFFTGTFPEKYHPPQQEILNSPLQYQIRVNDSQVNEFKWVIQV